MRISVPLLVIVTTLGCKIRPAVDSDTEAASSSASALLNSIQDHEGGEGGPTDTLSTEARTATRLSSSCGLNQGPIKLFKAQATADKPFFQESSWRKIGRPAKPNGCLPSEEFDADSNWCWGFYGLQMYPVAKVGTQDHYLVPGSSPAIRVIPKQSYPSRSAECRFDASSALILAIGIKNPFLGESWKTVDEELLASLIAWNRNSELPKGGIWEPSGHGKLKEIPGYIQIVGNKNTTMGGVRGYHEEQAISRMRANIELAYRSGVKNLEIVSHSNGMITAQGGLTQFGRSALLSQAAWQQEREHNNPGVGRMNINVYHLQAAPSQKWSFFELDKFGEYSDYLPNAKWVSRSVGGVSYKGWEWDFTVYSALDKVGDLAIRYYYNAVDGWTYPSTTTVGRKSSLSWHQEVKTEGYKRNVKAAIRHYGCDSRDMGECGPEHKQRLVLWDFTDPNYKEDHSPISWDLELLSDPAHAAMPAVASAGAGTVFHPAGAGAPEPKLPEVMCIDARANRAFCGAQQQATTASSADSGLRLVPMSVCSLPEDAGSPCTTQTCGDGICALGEPSVCPNDCKVPATYTTCSCAGGVCNKFAVSCGASGCKAGTSQRVEACNCESQSGSFVCTTEGDACEIASVDSQCVLSGSARKAGPPFVAAAAAAIEKRRISAPIYPRQ